MISYVYVITNKLNNKSYIGKTNRPTKRFNEHYRSKSYIGNALRKHAQGNFLFQIIEEHQTEEEAYEAEQFFIQYLGSIEPFGYNLDSGGLGGRIIGLKTKQKLSESHKGKIPWMKGKKHSEESKDKLSESHKGKILSERSKVKISESQKGRLGGMLNKKHSEKTKQKMSELRKGINNPFYGKCHSEEAKQKISKSRKGKR